MARIAPPELVVIGTSLGGLNALIAVLGYLYGVRALYGVPRAGQPGRQDVWVAALDNSAAPRVFLPDADSPIVVR